MKFLFILFFLISSSTYAVEDSFILYDFSQTTNEKTYSYNLKTLERTNLEKKDEIRYFNNKNFVYIMLGMEQEEFEEKDSFYKKSLNPSFSFELNKKYNEWLSFSYYFRTSTENFVAKQNLLISLLNFKGLSLNPLIQLGEKVALSEQNNSGYFFLNLGLNLQYEIGEFSLYLDYLQNYSDFMFNSVTGRIMYEIEKEKKIGLYFGIENYIPIDYEYERQGQRNVRGGFLYYY